MKLSHIVAAAGLAVAATGAAQAQPPQPPMHDHPVMHQRTVVETHTTTTTRHGMDMRMHHPRCHTEYHHHHRVRVCR